MASPTQPKPDLPEPFARQHLTEDMLTTRTPEAHAWAVKTFRSFRSNGQFYPMATDSQTIVFPGFDGGAEGAVRCSARGHLPGRSPAVVDMAHAIAPGELTEFAMCAPFICPITPLRYPAAIVDALMVVAEAGLPLDVVSNPVMGLTAPYTIAGSVARPRRDAGFRSNGAPGATRPAGIELDHTQRGRHAHPGLDHGWAGDRPDAPGSHRDSPSARYTILRARATQARATWMSRQGTRKPSTCC